ncbi:MAG: GNAT family protein [Allosphingosinicella sp.]
MGRWFGRKAGFGTLTFHNGRAETLRLWLEPWADEIEVPPASRVDLVAERLAGPAAAEFEMTSENLAFYAPGDSRIRILVDGVQVDTGSASIAAPDAGALGTRGFVQTVFGNFPEARPAGLPGDSLFAAMEAGDLSLEPLREEHRGDLKAACAQDGDIWRLYSISYDPDHFDRSFDLLRSRPNWQAFAILLAGELVGMSAFLGVDRERGVLEIGNTYYAPKLRGTGFNRRVKDMMLARAFGCGYRRVEFRVDARNGRSQAAMAKIGGVREGVLRQDRITWTGHVRDTVLFSILADEWKPADGA